jgi:hypothetical protein
MLAAFSACFDALCELDFCVANKGEKLHKFSFSESQLFGFAFQLCILLF